MTALARPARFAPEPQRRSLIAKVKIAQKELGLDEDTYRGALLEATGKMSAGDCTVAELHKALRHFEARGFKSKPGRKAKTGARPAADHAPARKARALWISLYQLGAIDNADDRALEAFAARQLKVEALQWANQAMCYKLVEALKAIAERHGWAQGITTGSFDASARVAILKMRLCEAILAKLKAQSIVPEEWNLERAAFELTGKESGPYGRRDWSTSDFEELANHLGAKLRSFRP